MAELKLGPPYVEDSQIRAVPRIARTFTNQEKRVFCNFEDPVNGFDRRTDDYLQIVLRGVPLMRHPVCRTAIWVHNQGWCLSLELTFKNLANSGCEISDNHSIPEADATNHAPGAFAHRFFLLQWLPLESGRTKTEVFSERHGLLPEGALSGSDHPVPERRPDG